ncbi:MAG: coproporphyrinogen III oxidase [Bacteroidetes bacterium]|nr:MAG: coproporphyrinogen III oxidase [Bacteroidota bacterium]
MSGIYVHVPFCRTACHYCDFHFSTALSGVDSFVQAMLKEIEMRRDSGVWKDVCFETLYLGGGTPSVLDASDLKLIVESINSAFRNPLGQNAVFLESTIEVNPEDVNVESLKGWRAAGFDRLSIGVQSFHDSQLKWMNRKHSGKEALRAVELASRAGFNRISVDLIYGLPQSEGDWAKTVETALSLPIDHISCYALTVEPRTVLGARVKKGIEVEMPDERLERDYLFICDSAKKAGFDHYEVSNWAKTEKSRAVHNSSYWSGAPYLGLGPGAHGFRSNERYSVVSNNHLYISSINSGKLPDTSEVLSKRDRCNEVMMTGLRTAKGVDFELLEKKWGYNPAKINSTQWNARLKSGDIIPVRADNEIYFRIPEKKWLIGDSIASDLFVT